MLLTAAFLVPSAFAQTAPATNALPSGGQVAAGQVTMATTGAPGSPTLNVTQGSDRAIVNWQHFDVGRDATVRFAQPSASSAILNRVVGTDASRVFGRVEANGQVFLVNPQGIYFGPTSSVDVGSFVASTLSIGDADFLAGRLNFRRDGTPGVIFNEGTIRSALGGYVALLAPEVRNAGLIMAEAGTVVLAAGEAVSFNFDPAAGVTGLLVDPARVQALVDNRRIVRAPGGQVIVSAQAHNELAAGVIRNTGEIVATGIAQDGGRIYLGASDTVEQGGLVDASSAAGKGGDVTVVAPTIALLDHSSLLADGELGGGRIRVGGEWQGGGTLPQSRLVTMAATALVDASARRVGMGGEVVLWSDVNNVASLTQAAGVIRARGGELGGDGGRVETSGRVLNVGSLLVDTRSPLGLTGDWLLDPVNITIADTGGNITPDQIRTGLLTSNVSISTAGSGSATGVSPTYSAGLGDITISSALSSLSANSLTLVADNNITVNAATSLGGALALTAGGRVTFNASVATSAGDIVVSAAGFAGVGAVTIANGGTLSVTQSGNSHYAGIIGGSGALSKAGAGALSLTGANTFAGGSTVTAGTIGVYHSTALGAGALNIGGATLRIGRAVAQVGNDIALTGATTVVFDTAVDYLLVGGGGGGGAHVGGGGGGGGVLIGSTTLGGGTSAISVALGGTGSTNTDIATRTAATVGANTTAFGLTAFGGGAGGNWTTVAATSGASGGGQGTNAAAIAGTQGFAGGIGDGHGNRGYLGGGGGGAGGVGGNAATDAGNGGIGLLSAITGSDTYYGGGGGGGVHGIPPLAGPGAAGLGGQGGGGAGAVYLVGVRAPGGLANTGGGGGGSGRPNNEISMGGNGGTGVVIVSYLGAAAGSGGTVTPGSNAATGRTLHTFNTTGANSLVLSALSTTLGGAISGSGALTVNATGGTISLSGANTSTGATSISGGTLRVGAGGATGALGAGAITNNAALVFNRTGTLTVAQAISGTGTVEQLAAGTTVLSGDVSHTGGTTVTAGTLRVGAGGTTGTLAGNVVSQGVLAFDRSDAFTFAGAISGAGGVTQFGSSNLILTGAATFTGVTTVDAGGVIFRRDVPPTTSGFAGVGTATVEPVTASFTSAVTTAYTYASTLTGFTLGKSANATAVTIGSAISIAGPIRVFGGDVTISANVTTTAADQPIVFQAVSNVLQNASRTIQTNGGDIVYWSNSSAATTGNRGILISDSTTLDSRTAADRAAATHTTSGGVIVLGGGSAMATSAKGTLIPTGYALNYTSVPAGLMIGSYNAGVGHNANVRMFSGGGDIVWRGRATLAVSSVNVGISAFEGVTVNAGVAGDITVDGVSVGASTWSGTVLHCWSAGTAASSYLTVDGDILLNGSGTGVANAYGTQLDGTTGFPVVVAATGAGTVTVRGTGVGTRGDVYLGDVQLLSGSGQVSLLSDRAGGRLSVVGTNATARFGQAASSVVTASSAAVLLRGDVFDVTSTNGVAINTMGGVEITSLNAIGFTATPAFSRLDVGRAVASAANNIGSFTFGKTTNTSAITLATGSVNALGPIRMYGSNLTIGIPLRTDAANAEILLQGTGFVQTSANFTTTGSASPLRFLAGGYFNSSVASTWTTSGSNVLVAANTDATGGGYIYASGNQSIVTSGGSVTLAGGDAAGSGYAEGLTATDAEGIRYFAALSIDTSVKNNGVSTGGGDVVLRGRSRTSVNGGMGAWGVGVDGVTTIDSGTGTIRIDGISRITSGDSFSMGIRFFTNASLVSASTSPTAIHVTGTGGSAASSYSGGQGIRFEGGANLLATTGTGGGIKLSGTNGAAVWAVVFQGGSILSASGPIELSGTNANSYVYIQNSPTIGFRAGTPVTASTANILLSFFDADWGNTANPIIATSGSFTFRPSGTSFNRAVSTNWFVLPNTLSGLTFGSPTNTAGVLLQSTLNVQGPVTLQGGYAYVINPLTAAGDILLDGDTGANLALDIYGVYVNAAVSTTAASNGSITLVGRGGNTANNFGVYLTSAGPLTAGGSGAISITGIGGANAGIGNHGILAYPNLTTSTGFLTLNGTGGGTGGSSMNRGIQLVGNIVLRTTTGALTFNGTGGVGANSEAFYFNDAGLNTLGAVGQSGDITLRGNSFAFGAGNVGVITSGSLTIEPTGTSFTAALNTQKFTLPALLTSATLGKAGNTGDITVANAMATSGAITITGGAIALNGALSSTGGNIGITTTALTGASGITIPATKTLTLTQSGSSTYDGAISGGGSLVKAGAGTLALSASSGFTGTTSISAGTLALGGGGTSGWLTGTTSIAVDGTLQIWRGDDVTLSLPLTGAGTIEVKGAYRTLYSSQLTTTAQTVASNTTVAEVMRRLAGGQLNGTAIPGTKEAAAYQVAFDPVTNVGRFQLQLYDGTYVKTVFVRLVQSGANVQALVDVASPFSKGTAYLQANQLGQDMASVANVVYSMDLATVNGGAGYGVSRLDIAGKTTLSGLGSFAGSLRLTTTTETGTGLNVYTRTIPGILEVTSGFGNLSGIVNNGLLYLNQATDTTLPNAISGTGGLFKLGAGNTTFADAATFTGETTVAAGRLTYQDVYGSSVHTILAGATLALDAAVDRDYASTSFRGTGTLVKSGDGRAQWGTSVATFALGTGAMIDVQGGIFTGSSNSNEVWTNNSADLNVATGARFVAVEGNVRVDALSGAGDVTVGFAGGVGSLTLGVDNHTAGAFSTAGSATFSGVIADTGASAIGALTKLGTGTQIFSGANTYTGATTVSAGTLAITDAAGLGTTAAGTTVASGATLDLRGVVVGAEALTLNGGTLATSTGTSSLSGAVTLGAASTLSVAGTQLTLSGIISGVNFGLTKSGAGLAVLTGVNTFTGNLAVDAGTLRIGGAGRLAAGTYVGAITVASGATFDFASSANQIFGTVTSGNVNNSASNTLRGAGKHVFGGTGAITLRGDFSASGTIEVAQAVTMTGGTNSTNAGLGQASGIDIKDGGTITLTGQPNSFIGSSAAPSLTIRAGGKLTTDGSSGQTFHLGLITLAGGELATGTGAVTTIWGLFNLDKTVTVTEDSTLSAQFTAMYQSGGTVFNVAAGKTLTVSGTLNLPSNGGETGLVLNSAAGNTGTMVLTGTNTYAGTTTITRGTLRIGGAGSLGSGTYANTVTNNGALEIATSANQTFSNVISGSGSVTKSGAGTTTLTATNTYAGTTTVSAGVLQVGNGGTTGALSASSSAGIASGATLRYFRADASTFSVAHAVSGDGTLEFLGTGGNGVGAFKLTGANTLSSSAVMVLNQAVLSVGTQAELSTSLPLVRIMTGGLLYVERGGTFGNPLELGAGLGWKFSDASQLGLLHANAWVAPGAVNFTGNVTLTGNSAIAAWANSSDLTMSGVISDGGNGFGFTKLGLLKLTLTGANTFTGTTTISAGTLQVGAGGTAGVLGGAVVNSSALIFDRSDALTFAPAISGTGTLTKAGANTLTLTGANTYTGSTTVTAGGIVFQRDVAPSTSGFAGAGTVTIESAGAAFTSAVASYTYAPTITGLTLGKSTNTSTVTLGAAIGIAGPVTVYGGNIAVNAVISATGDLLLDADTGAQLTGNFTGLAITANLSTTAGSNGSITLRGRGGNNSAGSQHGVTLTGVTVSAGGTGAVLIEGVGGPSVGGGNMGIRSAGTITTGSGNLTLTGVAGGTGASSNNDGIAMMSGAIARTVGGALLLDGTNGPGVSSESIAFETATSAVTFGQVSQTGSTTLRGDVLWVSTNNVSLLGSGAITIEPKGTSFGSALSTAQYTLPSTASGFTFGKAGNTAALTVASNLSITGPISVFGGDVTLTGGLAATAAGDILVRSSGVLTIAASRVLSTTNGDVTLTAARFVNNGGSGALSAGGTGKTWRVWSTNADPYHVSTGDVAGGLAFDFRQYDASYGVTTVQGTGKGLLYSFAPTLSASLTTTPTKVYDRTDTATVTNAMVTVASGYAGGDGTAVFTFSAATYASRNAGNGQAITFASDPTVVAQSNAGTGSKPVYGYRISGLSAPTGNITPRDLTLTGVTAAHKVYDRSLAAIISGGAVTPLSGDTVTVDMSSATGAFANWNVGTAKTVTVSGAILGGAEAGNYSVAQPVGLVANITARPLSITSVSVADKVYNRALAATLSGGAVTALSGDTVTVVASGASGSFADWNVGTGKAVTVSGYTLSGTDAGNYSLVQPTGVTANITPLTLNVTGATAASKTYDALRTVAISGGVISAISGDTVVLSTTNRAGLFSDKNVGNGKTVTVSGYAISGTDAGNYALVQPTSVTADIAALTLNITSATAANKTYDALLGATISGGAISIIAGDTVTLDTTNRAGVFTDKNVGTGKAVTVSGYTLTGADAANYALAQPTGLTADITHLALNVTGATAANKTYDAQLGATISGGAISIIAGDTVTLDTTNRAGVFADKNVGSGKSVTVSGYAISGADAANYALAQPTGLTADITHLALNVTGATAANKTYDALLAAAVSGGAISAVVGDTVNLVSSGRVGVFADKNVGNGKAVTVSGYTLSGADAGNYSLVQPTGVTANITAWTLNVTGATAANKTYDALLTAAISGGGISVISGDTVTLDATNRAGVFADKNVGTGKAVTVTGYTISGADAANYALAQPTGVTANITPLTLNVTGATAANKTYDALLTAAISGGAISVISGDTVNLVSAGRAGVFADKHVGSGKTVTVSGYTITGTDAGNYALVQPTGVTADITQLTLNVTGAIAANKAYDALLAAAISGGAISVISGDTVDLVSTGRAGVFADKNVGNGKAVTVSGYTLSGADAGNYALVQPTGLTAGITALTLNVTGATAANKVYDALLTATISGGAISAIAGDAVTLVGSGRAGVFTDKNVATGKSVTVTGYSLTGADAGNYALVQPTGVSADITALTLNVTGATAADKTYDALLAAAISGGAISVISGDTVTLVSSGRAGVFADKNVANGKSVTVSGYTITGTDAANYTLVQPTGISADITPLALNVTGATAASKTYDALRTAVISGGVISAISGDTVILSTIQRAGLFADKNVGTTKAVTISGYAISGADAANYALTQPTGVTADITALTLNVTGATAANKTYDALLAAAISGGAISIIAGDTLTLDTTNRAGAFTDKNVGTGKAVTVSGYTLTGTDAGNYALVQPAGVTADITLLTLNVTGATAANKTYDALLAATISGGAISVISGDTVTLVSSGRTGVFADKNVANGKSVAVSGYTITGTDAANYSLVQPTGITADITALTLNVTGATASHKTYDALVVAAISGGTISVISGDTVVLDTTNRAGVFADKNVGTGKSVTVSGYTISGAAAANYALAQPTGVTADITPLTLNVTGATAASKTYDALLGAVVSGGAITAIAGDAVTLDTTNRAGAFADKNVAIGKAVTVSGYTLSGTDAGNYSLVQPTGLAADITALTLNVTGATAANKTYDALLGAVISGGAISVIAGDAVTLVSTNRAGLFADKNVANGKSVTVTGYSLTGTDAANYSLVQPTSVTADITALTLTVTGASAANKTYDALQTAAISGGTISVIAGDAVTLDASNRAGIFGDKNVGTSKSVAVSGYGLNGADAANYSLVQPTGVTADITVLSLAVTGATAANKTYDALLTAAISGGTISVIAGDAVTLDAANRAGAFADKNVAIGKAVTVSGYTLSGTDAGNYSLVQPAGLTADIAQLTLNVTGTTAANKTYDALLAAAISGGVITVISGDNVVLDTTSRAGIFGDKHVGTTKSVTVSGYTISGTDAANYSLAQPTGITADITALALNVTGATAANKTYDALLGSVISGGIVSTISGDAVTLDASNRAGLFGDKNVGTSKSVAVSGYSLTGADAANYSLVQPTGVTADITALTLNVTGATAANKTYDSLLGSVISGGAISAIAGDDATLDSSGRTGLFADKNVGTGKAVTVSGYTLTGTDAGNYSLVQPSGASADITQLTLAVTGATAANKTYDTLLTAAISGGTIGAISGDIVSLDTTNRSGVFADKNIGTSKSVAVSGYSLTGADATNYALVQPAGVTADITPLTLDVTGATASNKTYDALVAAAISGGSISVIAGDAVTLDTSNRAGVFGDKNVGTSKSVTVSGYTITGADAANYSLVQPNGVTADISALALNVTGATAANKTYDALLGSVISGGAISAIAGDDATLDSSGRTGLFADKNVGTGKSVTVSGYSLTGADAGNYDLIQPTGVTADITQLTLNITGATAADKTYDAQLTAAISGGAVSAISGDDVVLGTANRAGLFGDKDVGASKAVTVSGYAISGADAANYSLVQPTGVTASITQLTLDLTGVTAADKTYDAQLTADVSGGSIAPISGDTVVLDSSARSGLFVDKNVGTAKAVTVSGYTISGTDAANYALVQTTGVTADITALALNVTGATAANKTYDALSDGGDFGGSRHGDLR